MNRHQRIAQTAKKNREKSDDCVNLPIRVLGAESPQVSVMTVAINATLMKRWPDDSPLWHEGQGMALFSILAAHLSAIGPSDHRQTIIDQAGQMLLKIE